MFIKLTADTIIAYKSDFVKLEFLQLPRLDLATNLETFWKKLNLKNQFIYAILAENAGFTDTRMFYIWLQSYKNFGGGDFVILNGNCGNLEEFELLKNQQNSKLFQKAPNIW
jgi:hypothetical protein